MAKTIIKTNIFLDAPITDPQHLVNKQYVDDLLGKNIKQPVRVATTQNLTYTYNSSEQSFTIPGSTYPIIDGIQLQNNDRILVKDQTTGTQNGIYVITSAEGTSDLVMRRSDDFNATEKIPKNVFIRVSDGVTQGDTLFQLTNNEEEVVLNTTPLVFAQYSSSKGTVTKSVLTVTGDGTQKEFTLNHNLDSKDIIVSIKQGNDIILVNWECVDSNSIRLSFDNPLEDQAELKVIIFN